MSDGGKSLIVRDNLLETLKKCQGYYQCPKDEFGKFVGPLVGYAGTYRNTDDEDFHFVGAEYYNFSRADQWPAVLEEFVVEVAGKVYDLDIEPTVILGAPWAGVKFSQAVAHVFDCRHIFAEKKPIIGWKGFEPKIVEEIVLSRYEINPGDRVFIGEELVNNCSTTAKLIKLVEDAGGEVIGIMCAINRSYPFFDQYEGIPIISAIEQPTPQYRQDESEVAELVKTGDVIWKPKIDHWPQLQKIMEEHGIF